MKKIWKDLSLYEKKNCNHLRPMSWWCQICTISCNAFPYISAFFSIHRCVLHLQFVVLRFLKIWVYVCQKSSNIYTRAFPAIAVRELRELFDWLDSECLVKYWEFEMSYGSLVVLLVHLQLKKTAMNKWTRAIRLGTSTAPPSPGSSITSKPGPATNPRPLPSRPTRTWSRR